MWFNNSIFIYSIKNYQDKEKAVVKSKNSSIKRRCKSRTNNNIKHVNQKDIDKTLIPENAIGDEQTLKNYSLQDKQGNEVSSKVENGENVLYLTKNNTDYKLEKDDSGSYYIERNNNKEYIQLNTVPVVAKVSLKKMQYLQEIQYQREIIQHQMM